MNTPPILVVDGALPSSHGGPRSTPLPRILVVEDEAVVAMDIQDRLQSLGYTVVGRTDSGEESIVLTEQMQPDLVLMDIRLQGEMDGIVAARQIRERFRRPVIFLTAYSEDATLTRAKVVEPFGYLLKPFEDRELNTVIQIALYKHQAETEILRLNRLYAVLSHVNQVIVRSDSREKMFRQICRAIVEQGAFSLAWIGWLDPVTQEVKPVAQWGERGAYLKGAVFYGDDRPAGRDPVGVAVRQGLVSLCNDIAHDPRMAPWRDAAAREGLRSLAVFPLRCGDRIVGTVNLYSPETGFFKDREISLLEELALDLSFGLDHLETEAQRRQSEERLHESEEHFRVLYDNTPLMMCLVNGQREVERMNRTMADFVGDRPPPDAPQHPGDLIGCINALDHPQGCGFGSECEVCPLRQAVIKTFETGQPCHQIEAELFLVRGGVRRQIQVSGSTALVRLQDQPKVVVCLENITERKQLQAQFLHAQKLEAIGQLAGGVAHDFNNILAAMLLHLQLLQQNPNLEPEMAASLRELQQGTQHAASLTRQLLLFSRRQVMQTRHVDLNEAVQGLMSMLQRLLGENIRLVFRPGPKPVWVNADVGMIEQVVMNLCVNARDSMPRGGQIDLFVHLLTRQAAASHHRPDCENAHFACLTVTDTGCGMDESTLKRIFEPFFTTKEPGKGTGLGLATVHGIAKQHHGWVGVESEVGRGTTFQVFLPAFEPPSVNHVITGQTENHSGRETILLVEDDAQLRRLIKTTLHKSGYEILDACDGVEAMRLWERHRPRVDLLFTDMIMPGGISGIDLAQRLSQFKPGLKVVISSGYAAELLEEEGGLPAGMRFLAKPYELDSLPKIVRECLDATG